MIEIAFIIDDILLSPITFLKWLGENIYKFVEEELTDESRVQEELLELQMRFEMDEITEEEYEKREAKLIQKLESIREYKEEGR